MKNVRTLRRTAAIVALIGLVAASCDNATTTNNDTPVDCGYALCVCSPCAGASCDCENVADDCGYAGCGCGDCEGAGCVCDEQQAQVITVDMGGGITMTMNRIEAGTFTRGQTGVATPVHQVTLTRDFFMGIHPVTREQFHAVMNANPSASGGTLAPGEVQGRRPVDNVNWYHAIAFANRLSIMQGLEPVYYVAGVNWETLTFAAVPTTNDATWNAVEANWDAGGFRLATDAEWEFAARAGTTTQWSFGNTAVPYIDYYAWTNRNSGGRTRQVGQLRPNPWGLNDMHGNVWEWVWDRWGTYPSAAHTDPTGPAAGDGRVIRGGSWVNSPANARSAIRSGRFPGNRPSDLGFRVVRS